MGQPDLEWGEWGCRILMYQGGWDRFFSGLTGVDGVDGFTGE